MCGAVATNATAMPQTTKPSSLSTGEQFDTTAVDIHQTRSSNEKQVDMANHPSAQSEIVEQYTFARPRRRNLLIGFWDYLLYLREYRCCHTIDHARVIQQYR